jgi:prepilin-type N-terminal cleavage/methylation domain-containing protein
MRRRRGEDEEGFTLIELLITVVILPLIVGALTLALVSVFSLQGGVSNRISDSADAQTVSANFANDVQSAALVTTDSTSTNPAPCGSSSQILGLFNSATSLTTALTSGVASGTVLSVGALPRAVASGDHIVVGSSGTTQTYTTTQASPVSSTTLTVASQTVTVPSAVGTPVTDTSTGTETSYVEVAKGSTYSLLRNVCQNGNTTTPVSSSVASYNVPAGQMATASCASTLTNGLTAGSASGVTLVVSSLPASVAVGDQLVVGSGTPTQTFVSTAVAVAGATSVVVTSQTANGNYLSGSPVYDNSWTSRNCGASTGWVATAPISATSIAITETAGSDTYVFTLIGVPRAWTSASGGQAGGGQPYLPLDLIGSCPNTSPVLTVVGGSIVNVGGSAGNGVLGVASPCAASISVNNGGDLNASTIMTSSSALTVTPSSGPTVPGSQTYVSSIPNPFTSLTAPVNPATPGSCAGSPLVCTPGYYVSAQSFGNGVNVTFSPGTYWFEGGVTIGGGITATFGTGTYIFGTSSTGSGNGLSIANNSVVSGSSLGVLLYIAGGTLGFAGGAGTSLVGLAAYDTVAIWQASMDTNAISLSNNTSSQINLGGIYAPSAAVNFSGGSKLGSAFVLAQSANLSNATTLNVG